MDMASDMLQLQAIPPALLLGSLHPLQRPLGEEHIPVAVARPYHLGFFGLYELVSSQRVWGMDVAQALNEALQQLGIEWVRVSSVEDPEQRVTGERAFHIQLENVNGEAFDMETFAG